MIETKAIILVLLALCVNYVSAFRSMLSSMQGKGKLSVTKMSVAATPAQNSGAIGWDSHKAVDSIPESLVRSIDGNAGMRKKFEQVCREAQVIFKDN